MADNSKMKSGTSGNNKKNRWLKNAIRSMGSASVVTFKSITPNISSTAAGARDATKAATRQISKIKTQNVGKIAKRLSQNQYVKIAKKAIQSSAQDLRSGNLYNPNRQSESIADSQFDDFEGFDDFEEWADDTDGNITFNYIDNDDSGSGVDAGSSMVAEAITESARTQLKASQATVDAFVGVSAETITAVRDGFADASGKLDAINSTLTAILDYHQENTTNFYNAALAAFERIGSAVDNEDSVAPKDSITDIFSASGGINADGYKKYLKSRLKKVVDESPVNAILPFLKEPGMVEALVSDPIGGLTKGVVGGMLPKVVEGTLREVDKTFGNMIPNMMVNIGKWIDSNESGIKGTIKKWIGTIFGINTKTDNKLSMQEITKDATTFDQITRNAIVEVLPKYARESTAYLREIAMHITKTKDNTKLLSSQEIFDTRTNSYKSTQDLTKEVTKSLEEAVTGAFTSTDFGKVLSNISDQLNSKDKKKYEDTLNQFFVQLANSDNMSVADYDVSNKNSAINDVLRRTSGSRKNKKLLREAIRKMYTDNLAIDSAARGQINAQNAWNEQLKDMSQNADIYNLHAIGLDNETDILEFLEGRQKNTAAKRVRAAKKKEDDKKEKDSEESGDSVGNKFKSAKDTAAAAIDAWKSGVEYQRDKDIGNHGKLAASVLGEDFGKGFKQAGSHAMNGMFMIMKGDSNAAIKEFSSIFTDQMKNIWQGMNEHFFSPLGKRLFGDKEDENSEGIFSGAGNKLSDIKKAFTQKIDGKDYTDSKGVVHKKQEGEESLVDKATNLFTTVKEGIFGKKSKNGEDDEEGGIFSSFKKSISEGLQGWKAAIFGEEEGSEESKFDKEKIKKAILDTTPTAIMGSAGGALVGALSSGSLLGMLIGGPVGGAVLGFAGSLLSKSNRFKDYLFGPEVEEKDADGNVFKRRVGGLISEKTQKFFKDNKSSIAGGAVLGAIKNMIFPNSFGLLSSVVGGPIAGAAVGVGFSLLKKSDMWQKFLYGDEEKGRQGVVTAFKSLFSGSGDKGDDKESSGARKMLGMGAIGGIGGALTAGLIGKVGLLGAMLTPGGVIGGALIGSALGIAAGGKKFSKWLFGEKDPETNERKGGMIQKFGNFMHVEVFAPMKSKALNIFDDLKTTIKFDILENIRLPFVAAADSIKNHFGDIKDSIKSKVDDFATKVGEKITPILDKAKDFIFKPIRAVVSKVTDIVYNSAKAVITLPFKLLGAFTHALKSTLFKWTKAFAKGVFKVVHGTFSFIKAGLKTFLFNPLKKTIGFVLGKIGDFFRKRKDKKDANGKPSMFSRVRNGFNRVRSYLTDDSYKKEYLQNKADRSEENAKNKKERTLRSQRDYNRAKMAEVLGYDVKYFTEENFEAAKAEAKKQKKKIKWRGNVKDLFEEDKDLERTNLLKKSQAEIAKNADKSEDIEVRQLGAQYRTNELLERIAEQNGISQDRAQELWDELREQRQEEAERAGVEYDEETGETKVRDESDDKPKKESLTDRMSREMDEAGSMGKYLKNKWGQLKGNIAAGYKGSWLDSKLSIFKRNRNTNETDESEESNPWLDYLEREATPEVREHARPFGGLIKSHEPYLVGDGGSDPSAAELIVPDSAGTVLSQKKGGIKTYITDIDRDAANTLREIISKEDEDQESTLTKTLEVISNIAEEIPVFGKAVSMGISGISKMVSGSGLDQAIESGNVRDYLSGMIPFGHHRASGGDVSKDDVYLVGDGGSDPSAAEIFVPKTSGKILSQKDGGINVRITEFSKDALKDLAVGSGMIANDGKEKLSDIKSVGNYTKMKEAADKAKEDEEDDARAEKTNSILTKILEKNEEHHFNWASIFSKKGILTIGAIALGGLLIKNIPGIVEAIKGIGNFMNWWRDNDAGTDGKDSKELAQDAAEDAKEVVDDVKEGKVLTAAKDFILDENEWDANSGARAKLVARGVNKGIKVASKVKNTAGKVISSAKKGVSSIKKIGSKILGKGGKAVESSYDDAIEYFTSNITVNGSSIATSSADDVAKGPIKKMATKVAGMVDDFIKGIISKITTKFPNASQTISKGVSKVVSSVKGVIEKHFTKISGDVSKTTATHGGAAAGTAGISEGVFLAIGAVNGLSGAARLFQVPKDRVDTVMTLISGAIGAFTSTLVGSIVDIVSGLVAEILGFDFINTVACIIYGAIMGEDAAAELNAAKEEHQAAFEEHREEQLSTEYETQKKAGLIGDDVTLEDFQAGIESGQYHAKLDSFQDWNAEENQTIGYKVGKGLTSIGKKVSSWWKGKTTYTDENGQQYVDNGNGTYTVIDKDGNSLGDISAESIDVSNMESNTTGGTGSKIVKKIGSGIKTGLNAIGKGINTVGSTIVDVGKGAFDVVKTMVSQNISMKKYILDGDVKGLIDHNLDVDENVPLGGVVKGLLTVDKMLHVPPAAISWVGHNAVNLITGFIDGASKVIGTLGSNISSIFGFVPSGDLYGLSRYKVDIPDDTPISGFVRGTLYTSKFISLVPTTLSWVGHLVGDAIGKMIDGVKKVATTIGTHSASMCSYIVRGDIEGLSHYEPQIPEDTPLSGMLNGIFIAGKFINYIPTAISWVGHKVASGIASMIDGVKQVAIVAADNSSQLQQFAKDGDLEGLGDYEPQIPEDTPLSGMIKGVYTGAKFVNYIPTAISWVGHKVASGIASMIDGVKQVASAVGTEVGELATFAKDGDLEGLGDYSPDIPEDTPLSGILNGVFTGAKFVNYIPTAISWVGHKVGGAISGFAKDVIGNVIDVAEFASTLWDYGDNDKDMDSFDNESAGDGMIGTIISPVIKFVMKPIVQVKRVFNMIGDWIKDKIGKIGDFFGGLFDSARRFATGDYDDVDEDEYGGSGRGVGRYRRSAIGGRGETENGFAYYSQEDPRWKNQSYISGVDDGATMGDSGCGPTAMAMVATQAARGSSISPTDMARAASQSGFRDETGTNEKFISYAGDSMGMAHTDVMNPSPAFIAQNASMGNPVILNGVGNGAFTPSGHYVVAVGTDEKGNVMVNDPRGKGYSKSYSPNQLAKQTRKAWSFGGAGLTDTTQTGGTSGLDWLSIVKSVKQAIAAKQLGYSQQNFTDITLNGRTISVRTDCSGFVGACLKFYGAIPDNVNITSAALGYSTAIPGGFFTQMPFPGWEGCQAGDILVAPGEHTEIYAGNGMVYNCGSNSSNNNPGATSPSKSHTYKYIWRPNEAGTGANVISIDGTAASSDSGAITSTSATSSDSSSSGSDILSRVGNVFTQFASKAMTGLLTGNWDSNFSDSGSSSTAGGTDSGTGSSVVAANVDAGEEQKSIWDYFSGQGLTKEGVAGLMGNLEQESGNHAIRLQGDMAPPYAKSQEYTKAADSGSNDFVGDSKGYGLAQWTFSTRKQGLLDAAKANGTSVGDLGTQLAYLNNELNTKYPGVLNTLKTATDIKTASNAVLHDFESPADQSASVENARASLGQGYYDKFAGGSGGFGRRKPGRRIFGGRGPEFGQTAQVSSVQNNYSQTSIPSQKTNGQSGTINTATLEQLLQNVIQVLQSIDGNTSKIEGLSSGSFQSVNNGGNVIVSNDNSTQISNAVRDNMNAMMPKSSNNSILAQQIARGR